MYLDILSFSYIDNREFPGVEGVAPSGPLGYQWFISSGIGELCKTIVAILIESCALYTASSLLIIGLWAARNYVVEAVFPILAEAQVRAFP